MAVLTFTTVAHLMFDTVIYEANLARRAFATDLIFATSEALEKGAPLEVNKRHQHDAETTDDRDVERPVYNFLFLRGLLVSEVAEFELNRSL